MYGGRASPLLACLRVRFGCSSLMCIAADQRTLTHACCSAMPPWLCVVNNGNTYRALQQQALSKLALSVVAERQASPWGAGGAEAQPLGAGPARVVQIAGVQLSKRKLSEAEILAIPGLPGLPDLLGDRPLRLLIGGNNPSEHAWCGHWPSTHAGLSVELRWVHVNSSAQRASVLLAER